MCALIFIFYFKTFQEDMLDQTRKKNGFSADEFDDDKLNEDCKPVSFRSESSTM